MKRHSGNKTDLQILLNGNFGIGPKKTGRNAGASIRAAASRNIPSDVHIARNVIMYPGIGCRANSSLEKRHRFFITGFECMHSYRFRSDNLQFLAPSETAAWSCGSSGVMPACMAAIYASLTE